MAGCIEKHRYTAISGRTGNLPQGENSDIHYAKSGIFTLADAEFARDGIAAECNPNVTTLIVHDVDMELLQRHRESGSVQNRDDRRTDMYKVIYQENGNSNEV